MSKYTIGVDFGTLSARGVIVDAITGEEIMSLDYIYPHAVIEKLLPTGEVLLHDWALQDPKDYLDALSSILPGLLNKSNISADNIIGIGTDFTACTLMPVKADGTPLCFFEEYKRNPHSWPKLWKHHAAQGKANYLNKTAKDLSEKWLDNYGGKISSEWAIPKIMQIAEEAADIYKAADRFIEAADWIVWQLCGEETRNSCTAGYKEIWNKKNGYPSKEFFKALNPLIENVVSEKLGTKVTSIGNKAGEITEFSSRLTGLKKGTAVAIGNVDAHVCVPALGIDGPGKILAIIGTSTCHILMGEEEKQVPGMCGVVEDGVLPGYFGYEAGQSCVGDHFDWFVRNCVPKQYYKNAEKQNIDIHNYLTQKAKELKAGESGLLALDWWNGNRSILVDVDLTGMIIGMTLHTRPEEIYRALIEATAYGTRIIVENFINNGVPINEFYASGGISQKNDLMMQIYADVLDMPVKIAGSANGPALGSAIFASVAAGEKVGGHKNIFEAAKKMGKTKEYIYTPNKENAETYNILFAEYKKLHDYFGRGENNVMKCLKEIKKNQSS